MDWMWLSCCCKYSRIPVTGHTAPFPDCLEQFVWTKDCFMPFIWNIRIECTVIIPVKTTNLPALIVAAEWMAEKTVEFILIGVGFCA